MGGVGPLLANAILNFHFDFLNTSLIDVANVCVLSFCWLVVVWLPMRKVTKENFVDHTRCAKRESCNRNHLDAETLCHKKIHIST